MRKCIIKLSGNDLMQEFLSPKPPPPAIREAMAKAIERKQKGLPVFDFSSGNVGNLALNQELFSIFELKVNRHLPAELRPLAEGLREGIMNSYYPNPFGLAYSPTGGTEPVKKLVIRYFREIHGVPLSDEDSNKVIATAGGQQAMTASLRSLKPGTSVLLPRWEYEPIPGILRGHNLDEVRIETNEDLSIDIENLRNKVRRNSVFYLSMPNNPSGYFSPEDLEAIMRILSANDGGVIWDAPYIFTLLKITKNGATFERAFLEKMLRELKRIGEKYYQHLCILTSLSKTCLIAGLRFGFATASERWIENMSAIIGRENLSSPTPSFIAGTAVLHKFLDTPVSHEWVSRVLAERLTVLMEEIPEYIMLPRNGIFGALYVLVRTNQGIACTMEERGIVTVAGSAFHGGPTDSVRVSLVSVPWTESDEAWIQSVKTLKKALTSS